MHLYSGADEGFTLSRAVKEAGGDESLLLEVDVKNGKEWNMLGEGVYEVLLRLAFDDEIRGAGVRTQLPNQKHPEAHPNPRRPDSTKTSSRLGWGGVGKGRSFP